MTLEKLIENILTIKGQQFDNEIITSWINEIEGQAIDEVFNKAIGVNIEFVPYDYATDMDRKLYIPDRFQDVYTNYIYSKIDFLNQETERYNNDVVMFNAAYESFSSWYLRNNKQKSIGYFSGF